MQLAHLLLGDLAVFLQKLFERMQTARNHRVHHRPQIGDMVLEWSPGQAYAEIGANPSRREGHQGLGVLDFLDLVKDDSGKVDIPKAVLIVRQCLVGRQHPPFVTAAPFDRSPKRFKGKSGCTIIGITAGKAGGAEISKARPIGIDARPEPGPRQMFFLLSLPGAEQPRRGDNQHGASLVVRCFGHPSFQPREKGQGLKRLPQPLIVSVQESGMTGAPPLDLPLQCFALVIEQ